MKRTLTFRPRPSAADQNANSFEILDLNAPVLFSHCRETPKNKISVRTWNLSLQTLSVQVLPRAGISSYPRQFIGATPKVIFTVMYD